MKKLRKELETEFDLNFVAEEKGINITAWVITAIFFALLIWGAIHIVNL